MSSIQMPSVTRMPLMGTRKSGKPKSGGKGKYKPYRAVRIPERYAMLLQQCADEDGENFAWEVRAACRSYLRQRGKITTPPT